MILTFPKNVIRQEKLTKNKKFQFCLKYILDSNKRGFAIIVLTNKMISFGYSIIKSSIEIQFWKLFLLLINSRTLQATGRLEHAAVELATVEKLKSILHETLQLSLQFSLQSTNIYRGRETCAVIAGINCATMLYCNQSCKKLLNVTGP